MPDRNSTLHSENMNKEKHDAAQNRASREVHVTRAPHDLPAIPHIYAIIDSVTDQMVGGLQVHLNDAAAIRTLMDIASGDTMLNKHPLDYDLYCLGRLSKDHQITADKQRIITGHQIHAFLNPPAQKDR